MEKAEQNYQPKQPQTEIDEEKKVGQQKPAAVATPKPQTTTPAAKPVQKSVNGVNAGTYIQVSSVAKANPDAKFIKTITDKSYPYVLYKTEVSGQVVTKVLVGPYESATAARDALVKIKSDLAPSAFIFRVK